MLNSYGRHVNVYFAVYLTLVLAFRFAEVDCTPNQTATCSQLGRQDSGRHNSISVENGV